MPNGFERGRLAGGCLVGFRSGVDGSPITVVVEQKGVGCLLSVHVEGMSIYDHREALRRPTRFIPFFESDWEEEG